jgi:hypothetical protein
MAGSGRKVWTGETLSVPDLQDYLQDQVVMQFDNAAARDAAIPAPTDGMHVHLRSLGITQVRVGGVWRPVGYQPRAHLYATAAQSSLATGYQTINMAAALVDDLAAMNAGGFVCPAAWAGRWRLSGAVAIGAVGTGNLSGITEGGRFVVNSTALAGSPGVLMPVSSQNGTVIPLITTEAQLNSGDVVALQGYVNTGGWSTLGSNVAGSSTSVLRLERIPT